MSRLTRSTCFGVTILPKNPRGRPVKWKSLDAGQKTERLEKLGFIKPLQLGLKLKCLVFFSDVKLKSGSYGRVRVKNFGGQLEIGSTNEVPHFQLWLEVSPRTTKTKLLEALSLELYGEKKSSSISVIYLTKDTSFYKDYCMKDERANLLGDFSNVIITPELVDMFKYIEGDEDLKKFLTRHILTKNTS